jgi:cytochrome c5
LGTLTTLGAEGMAQSPPSPPVPPPPPTNRPAPGPKPLVGPVFRPPAPPPPSTNLSVVSSPVSVMPLPTKRPPQFFGPVAPVQPMQPPRTLPTPVGTVGPSTPPDALVFDAQTKEHNAKPGETSATITFLVTNKSDVEVAINNVHTSCGCTVAKLPAPTPWRIAPGQGGAIETAVDLRGKRGTLMKSVTIQSSSGVTNLMVKVNIPDDRGPIDRSADGTMLDADRVKNIQASLVNPQAVFTDRSCAVCHADKAAGKMGKELFDVACAICHEAPHRATMVPDLKLKNPGTRDAWKVWISAGRSNIWAVRTLMPAFAKERHGILSDEQIESVLDYVVAAYPPVPQKQVPAWAQPPAQPVIRPAVQPVSPPVAQPAPSTQAARASVRPAAPPPQKPGPGTGNIPAFTFPN